MIESATARRPATRNDSWVEIWFPPDKRAMKKLHLSPNITHLPRRESYTILDADGRVL